MLSIRNAFAPIANGRAVNDSIMLTLCSSHLLTLNRFKCLFPPSENNNNIHSFICSTTIRADLPCNWWFVGISMASRLYDSSRAISCKDVGKKWAKNNNSVLCFWQLNENNKANVSICEAEMSNGLSKTQRVYGRRYASLPHVGPLFVVVQRKEVQSAYYRTKAK